MKKKPLLKIEDCNFKNTKNSLDKDIFCVFPYSAKEDGTCTGNKISNVSGNGVRNVFLDDYSKNPIAYLPVGQNLNTVLEIISLLERNKEKLKESEETDYLGFRFIEIIRQRLPNGWNIPLTVNYFNNLIRNSKLELLKKQIKSYMKAEKKSALIKNTENIIKNNENGNSGILTKVSDSWLDSERTLVENQGNTIDGFKNGIISEFSNSTIMNLNDLKELLLSLAAELKKEKFIDSEVSEALEELVKLITLSTPPNNIELLKDKLKKGGKQVIDTFQQIGISAAGGTLSHWIIELLKNVQC